MSSGHRELRLYQVTEAGLGAHLEWLQQPVAAETVAADLGQHLMRFTLMEKRLERAAVLAFLADLAGALGRFAAGVENFVATTGRSLPQHAVLALEHGIAMHRASQEWARSAMATLTEADASPMEATSADA